VNEAGWTVLDARRAVEYQPLSRRDLLFDLARVTSAQEAVSFAAEHGLLWHGPGSSDLREPFEAWRAAAARLEECFRFYRAIRGAGRGVLADIETLRHFAPAMAPA